MIFPDELTYFLLPDTTWPWQTSGHRYICQGYDGRRCARDYRAVRVKIYVRAYSSLIFFSTNKRLTLLGFNVGLCVLPVCDHAVGESAQLRD